MKDSNNDLCILVLSCDGYSDLWDDFFNLRDKYWNDIMIRWYVVTETKEYQREGVTVIHCGKEMNWAARFRKAVEIVDTPYIGIFLEDYFITDTVDIDRVKYLIELMKKEKVTYINVGDVFKSIINMPNKEYFAESLIKIPNNKRYGISTVSAIWEKKFLLQKLGTGDYSAWQFEIDRCHEASTPDGLGGFLLCDEKCTFNVSTIPVVIQGKFYPKAILYFKHKGYTINTSRRAIMSFKQVCIYKFKVRMSKVNFMRKHLKWIGSNLLGINFFTKD